MTRTILAMTLVAALAAASAPSMLGEQQPTEHEEKAQDPVCHMMVRKDPALSTRHGNQVYYFCMKADLEAFKKDPERYLRQRVPSSRQRR